MVIVLAKSMGTSRNQSHVGDIWTKDYPFEYWKNRLKKLEKQNNHDALDALFIHSHLADIYATTLAARINRPTEPWYVIKDELPTYKIHNTLEKLEEESQGETRYFVENMLSNPDEHIDLELPEEWKDGNSQKTYFVNQFLGCPANFDMAEHSIDLLYDPDVYMAICNSIINYWKQTTDFLNDFKHGFRIIPFTWDRLEWLYENKIITADTKLESVRNNYDYVESDWTFDFWRMETGEDDKEGTPVNLEIHTADINRCLIFSKLTLKMTYNLFDRNDKWEIGEEFQALLDSDTISQGESRNLIHQQFSLETRFS